MTSEGRRPRPQATFAEMRDYTPADDEPIRQTIISALAAYGLSIDPQTTDADLDDIPGAYLLPGGRFRILEVQGTVVGFYGLKAEGRDVFELRKMYLAPEFKGQGLGRLLLQDAMTIAHQMHARSIVLETNSRLIEACTLYRSVGFTPYVRASLSARCDMAMRIDFDRTEPAQSPTEQPTV